MNRTNKMNISMYNISRVTTISRPVSDETVYELDMPIRMLCKCWENTELIPILKSV